MAYGTVNADVIGTSVAGSNLGAGNASIMKNRIINGAMVIDQRNAGASVATSNGSFVYTLDRWKAYYSQTSKYTIQQNAGSVTKPVGFPNYLGITSSSAYSVASGDIFVLQQLIEAYNTSDLGWGTANAKTVTLSFQVYSSLTGTFGGSINNDTGSRSYPFSYTVSSANTWTPVSVTIAGDTTGTWNNNNNSASIVFSFGLGVGSTYSGTAGSWGSTTYYSTTGATSVVGTNGATFYITGVQLEVGSSATGFEYRQYQQELALCQRYYYQFMGQSAGNAFVGIASGLLLTTTMVRATLIHRVSMRTSPTITPSASGTISVQAGSSSSTVTGITAYTGPESSLIDFAINAAGVAGQGAVIFSVASNQFLTVSAEL
jgi:hypothetical protein